jgi:hypothetical protein
MALTNPDLSKDAFPFGHLAVGFPFILGDVSNHQGIRSDRLHAEIAQGITEKFELVRCIDFRFLVAERAQAFLKLAEAVINIPERVALSFCLKASQSFRTCPSSRKESGLDLTACFSCAKAAPANSNTANRTRCICRFSLLEQAVRLRDQLRQRLHFDRQHGGQIVDDGRP